jgi:hypothetical protein
VPVVVPVVLAMSVINVMSAEVVLISDESSDTTMKW